MAATIRPRRSMLYVPGDKPRAIAKALSLPADGLILDLEDAVAPENKDRARASIAEMLADARPAGRELILRLSAADCAEDHALAARLPLDGVLVPKVEDAATVRAAAARTDRALWCMIETPLGVLRAAEIAAASPRLAGLVAGTNDLANALRARHVPDRAPLVPSLSLMLLAARAHGLAAIDGVHLDLDDAAGFEAACRQGRDMGFDGKSLVHPATVEAANRLFAPSGDDLARAEEVVAGWAARAPGTGVVRIGDAMVERLHVDEAERLLALAAAIRARG